MSSKTPSAGSVRLPSNVVSAITPYQDQVHREQVVTLWQTVFGYQSAHNQPAVAIDKKLAVADGLFFVALDGEQVIGTIMAGYDGHRGWLYSVAVAPSHRRQGLGSQLVNHAERALAAKGCPKINLQVMPENAAVTAFYAALGYAEEPRISMGKKVSQNVP